MHTKEKKNAYTHTHTHRQTHTHTHKTYTEIPKATKVGTELRESSVCLTCHLKIKHPQQALSSSHDGKNLTFKHGNFIQVVYGRFFERCNFISWFLFNCSKDGCSSITIGIPGRATYRSGLRVLSSLRTLSMPRILVPELEMRDTRMSMTEIITNIPSRMFQLLLR